MICITSNVAPTRVPPKTYRIRNDAIDAALLALGPLARPGFEFKTWKCDGVWHWRALDEVPEPTHAQLKANGGRKFMGTAMASITSQGTIAPASEALAARVAVLEALVGELILRQAHSDH
jgi:hypothetical protein